MKIFLENLQPNPLLKLEQVKSFLTLKIRWKIKSQPEIQAQRLYTIIKGDGCMRSFAYVSKWKQFFFYVSIQFNGFVAAGVISFCVSDQSAGAAKFSFHINAH